MLPAPPHRHALRRSAAVLVSALAGLPGLAQTQAQVPSRAEVPGADNDAKTRTLEAGARLLQRHAPVAQLDIHLDGFHPLKEHPDQQMEAHHYCHQLNEDFAQCALFDGSDAQAHLTGVEYIVSERLYETLPEAEKRYWHPHNGEILSGQLIAPGIPQAAEKALMKDKINSYGKTWHLWHTGLAGRPADPLPMGDPMLAWSFNREGEVDPDLVDRRDRRLGIRSADKQRERRDLQPLARPQAGVDSLKGAFPNATQPIPGVVERGSGGQR